MGKSSEQTVGYHYRVAYHVLLTFTCDAFLEFRGAEKTAWDGSAQQWNDNGKAIYKRGSNRPIWRNSVDATGPITFSQRIEIGAPMLFGGEKDQGGIVGPVDIMFGEADQVPNPYLQSVFGNQTAAWRGFTTIVFAGGRFGAMNPMPQKPSYKIRKILKGWDEPGCWYPEKAEIGAADVVVLPVSSDGWDYVQIPYHASPGYENLTPPASGWAAGVAPFGETWTWPGQPAPATAWNAGTILWTRRTVVVPPNLRVVARVRAENGAVLFVDGMFLGAANRDNVQVPAGEVFDFTLPAGTHNLVVKSFDEQPTQSDTYLSVEIVGLGVRGMNPAHSLYYVRTSSEKGRELRANINDDSLRAAADQLHAEGFGLCWEYDPARDTPDSFEERICRIIGGSFERSLTDGQWYLDLARGDYDIESLPIIGDDDILEFKESPTTLDRAVNSMAVKYFDVQRKEAIITPAVRALGLIRRFGEIHETLDFPEIPTGALALRVADRELRARVTPTRTFELVTNPRMKGLRRNQYFRLQSPKRGIADMVCIVGSKEHGTLASGAIRWKVSQDVYALPDTSYIEIEEGVDTSPPTTPAPIEHARVFEAPYIDLVATLPGAELEALAADAGFLFAVAASPGVGLEYVLCVEPSGDDYRFAGSGEWCPTTTAAGAYPAEAGPTVVALDSVAGLEDIALGAVVIWDDEWCRLDGLDVDTLEATLGRGCGDTVPHAHAAGSRLWFFVEVAADTTEYSDGESVNVKLLPETGTQQLPLDLATAIPFEFDGRQARPYPPAALTINTEAHPEHLEGSLVLVWAHRDRVLQADQLIDQATASTGPEPGTTYTVRCYVNGALDDTQSGITGATANVDPGSDGLVRIEVEAVRDGLVSWQLQMREFDYTIGAADPWELQGEGVLQTQIGNAIHLMTE